MDDLIYKCNCCGELHVGLPSFNFDAPAGHTGHKKNLFSKIFSTDFLNSDFCQYGDGLFIKALLKIPIRDSDYYLSWAVWVSQSKENFKKYYLGFNEDLCGRETFGRLSSNIPYYENTVGLETVIVFQNEGYRPLVYIQDSEHQLSKDFHTGISLEKAIEFASNLLHEISIN